MGRRRVNRRGREGLRQGRSISWRVLAVLSGYSQTAGRSTFGQLREKMQRVVTQVFRVCPARMDTSYDEHAAIAAAVIAADGARAAELIVQHLELGKRLILSLRGGSCCFLASPTGQAGSRRGSNYPFPSGSASGGGAFGGGSGSSRGWGGWRRCLRSHRRKPRSLPGATGFLPMLPPLSTPSGPTE